METRTLGKTNLQVSAIGLGAMPLSLSNRPSEAEAIQLIHRALDLGITLIDTADAYCLDENDKHHNERLIGKALQQYSGQTDHVVVATKGGLMRPQGSWTRNGNPHHLETTIQASYEALGGAKPIDLWQYHSPDPAYKIQDSLQPVKAAVEAGIVRYVGVSNFSVAQIQAAREVVEIVSVQNQFNPWHRDPEFDGVLEYCAQEQITFLPWSPFGGSRRVQSISYFAVITELAKEKGISPYNIVLAWLRSKSPWVLPIPGASKISSLEDNVQGVGVTLTPEEVQKIDRDTAS